MKTPKKLIIVAVALAAVLAGCTSATGEDQRTTEEILQDLQKAHPVPQFKYSQYRQNLIEVVTAQAESTATTTFFFNQGVQEPINSCASVGFPIPTTAQLTNPERYVGSGGSIPQVEPQGVYTGESSGTYVICRDANGRGYAVYWEGFVQTVTGPAEWTGKGVELVGEPTGDFSTGKE